MRNLWLIGIVGACLASTGANCAPSPPKAPPAAALLRFSSAEELRTFLADQAIAQMAPEPRGGGLGGLFFGWGAMAAPATLDQADAANGQGLPINAETGDNAYSTTNIQEAGVDESDLVKNNGDTIYILDDRTIHIVKATPPEELAEMASFELDSYGDSLYLRGDKLIALCWQPGWMFFAESDWALDIEPVGGLWNDGSQTIVTVIDVSDPAKPTLDQKLEFEGDLVSSRLVDNKLHLIMTTAPRLPDNPTPETIRNMTLDQWLPDYRHVSSSGVGENGDIVGWQGFFRPADPCGYRITTIATIDVDQPDAGFESAAISANADVIYASPQALYITDTIYDWETFTSREDTIIHKLAFTEQGVDYVASGLVPGRPLNSYAMGEFEDYLRIATTINIFDVTGNRTSNNVYVLGESANGVAAGDANDSDTTSNNTAPRLEIVGKVEDIAVGETIYAARFIGSRGFLVTFKRIDPLFTMNLSDPTNPKVVGKLKVPGYSDHIQLMDENHLLTIGKDAQDVGSFAWIQGVQLSIFDVSDMTDPQLLHKEIIGGRGTHSEANYDPKAFNYFAPLNALTLPIDLYTGNTEGPAYGSHEFTGLLVYRVTVEDGFQELGRISSVADEGDQATCFWDYYGLTRGIFIDNTVYAATQTGVKAASLDDVSTLTGQTSFTSDADDLLGCADYPLIALPLGEGLR